MAKILLTMTDVKTDPVEDIAATHDFEPECEVDILIMRQGISTGIHKNKCTQPAVWLGIPPCRHDAYFCAEHHYDQRAFMCKICGRTNMLLATYNWIRL